MLNELKFVQGAIAKKDFVPALSHFHIENGYVTGYNGMIALRSPIEFDLTCSPKAAPFVKAILTCGGDIDMKLASNGKLIIKSEGFTCNVDCLPEPFNPPLPTGETYSITPGFVESITLLKRFISIDASRPWSRGIMFRNQMAYATNNVILVQRWVGTTMPLEVNVPSEAVDELVRIGKDPISVQASSNTLTFHYDDDKYLLTQLAESKWPDADQLLDAAHAQCNLQEMPGHLYDCLKDLMPFVGESEKIYLRKDKVSTAADDGEGASFDINIADKGVFNIHYLQSLDDVATHIDFAAYPNPIPFTGPMLRGIIMGMTS